jgi:carboxynorspermidine decarboxylase
MKPITKISHITPKILDRLPSPVWLLEAHLLEANLEILKHIKEQTGVKILLALKGFAFWREFDIIKYHLEGVCASGLHEAMLGREEFGEEIHTYSPAYKSDEIDHIAGISNHMVFNSPEQLERFSARTKAANPALSLGLRVNPESSAAPTELYNPCAPYSRLGTLSKNMNQAILKHIDGLHFHALCEQDANALEQVLEAFEAKFGAYLPALKWVNFGGGHHITRADYDRDKLIALLNDFRDRHPHLDVYLEPGEAVGWETGSLIATVLDIVHNGIDIAILDTSAEAHMPDTLLMPYRAEVRGAGQPGDKPHTYRLAGNTCLAGDIMGDYSFDTPLQIGDRVIFEDQMHYTMVKATTFNGIALPAIAVLRKNGEIEIVREFGYKDFKGRLG